MYGILLVLGWWTAAFGGQTRRRERKMSIRPFSGLHICAGRYVSDCSEKIEYINVKSIKALLTRLTLAFHRWSALLRHINEFPRLRARHDAQFWRNHTHRRYNQLAQWWVMNHYTHAHKRVILCHTFDIWPLKNGCNFLHTVPHFIWLHILHS